MSSNIQTRNKTLVDAAHEAADKEYNKWLESGESYEDWRMNHMQELRIHQKHLSVQLGLLEGKFEQLLLEMAIHADAQAQAVKNAKSVLEVE